jgi:biotin transport system substrate-specific component
MAESALLAAVICVLAPISLPIGPVPISLATFAVMLAGTILDWKQSTAAVCVYILLGACGLPVFSSGNAGFAVLAGPTGGYIWSYLLMAVIMGLFRKIPVNGYPLKVVVAIAGCVAATAVCYTCGTIQFMAVAGYTLTSALAVCVVPFIPFDLIKAVCASLVGVTVRLTLIKQGLLK